MAKNKISTTGKQIYYAKDYKSRQELDDNIRAILGTDGNNKEVAIIKGSKEELLKLHLSEDTTVYDVSVKQT